MTEAAIENGTNIPFATQYQVNKMGFEEGIVKPMEKEKIVSSLAEIEVGTHKFMMLMNKDVPDYTIFHMVGAGKNIGKEIEKTLATRGKIVWVEKEADEDQWEIWIKCDSMMKFITESNYVMFRFFPCENWIVEV